MQLTMDGMIRAMRMKAHQIGDEPEKVRHRAAESNRDALTLLTEESRRLRLEAGDEFGR